MATAAAARILSVQKENVKMEVKQKIVDFSVRRYRLVTTVMVVFTIALGSLIPAITVDTDPENMLSEDEPVRVFHNEAKNALPSVISL